MVKKASILAFVCLLLNCFSLVSGAVRGAVPPGDQPAGPTVQSISVVSPANGAAFTSCTLVDGHQPTFRWTATEPFRRYTVLFSTSPDFQTPNSLILMADVKNTKNAWKPHISSWLRLIRRSYNLGNVQDIYWKVVGKRPGSTDQSPVASLRIGPTQFITIRSPSYGDTLDSGTGPTFSFSSSCNLASMLQFSPLSDFSDPTKIVSCRAVTRDPNRKPTIDGKPSWARWTAVKEGLREGGFFRVEGLDGIGRMSISDPVGFNIHYWLVGSWAVNGTETVTVSMSNGGSATEQALVDDQFTFHSDFTFEMIDTPNGHWVENPGFAYTMNYPYSSIASYFKSSLEAELGTTVDVSVTSLALGGKEGRGNDTINGTMVLRLFLSIPAYALTGTADTYLAYAGTRVQGNAQTADQGTLSKGANPLGGLAAKTISKAVKDLQ